MTQDEQRWKEVERLFDSAKTSASERILEALGLDPEDACEPFANIIDAVILDHANAVKLDKELGQ